MNAHDESAFRQAILNSPLDDTPSWIYADWLEEQGELDRASLIRVQMQSESMSLGDPDRIPLEVTAQRILKKNPVGLWSRLPDTNSVVQWDSTPRGGLVREAAVIVTTDSDAARALELLETYGHVRNLSLNVRHTQALRRLVLSPVLKQIRELTILQPYDESIHALLTQGRWENLAWLKCPVPLHMVVNSERIWLDELPLPQLRRLDLRGHSKSPGGTSMPKQGSARVITSLLESKSLEKLRHLELTDFSFEPRTLRNFAASSAISQLESFGLVHCDCPGVVTILAQWSGLIRLKTLRLVDCEVSDVDAVALADSDRFPHLETLDLAENLIGDEGLTVLAGSPLLEKLSWLSLQYNNTRFQNIRHFRNHSGPSQLRYLRAAANWSSQDAINNMEKWPILDQLAGLEFSSTAFQHNDVSLLTNNPRLRHLKKLRILFPQLDDQQVVSLALSPHLKSLIWLQLDLTSGYGLLKETINTLHSRFQDSFCNLIH